MVKDYLYGERGNPLLPIHKLIFPIGRLKKERNNNIDI